MTKEEESWEEEDGEKLEESKSVCECNSLPLSNPREFTDCRGVGGEVERHRQREREREEVKERRGVGWEEEVGATKEEIERYRERRGKKDDCGPLPLGTQGS